MYVLQSSCIKVTEYCYIILQSIYLIGIFEEIHLNNFFLSKVGLSNK